MDYIIFIFILGNNIRDEIFFLTDKATLILSILPFPHLISEFISNFEHEKSLLNSLPKVNNDSEQRLQEIIFVTDEYKFKDEINMDVSMLSAERSMDSVDESTHIADASMNSVHSSLNNSKVENVETDEVLEGMQCLIFSVTYNLIK